MGNVRGVSSDRVGEVRGYLNPRAGNRGLLFVWPALSGPRLARAAQAPRKRALESRRAGARVPTVPPASEAFPRGVLAGSRLAGAIRARQGPIAPPTGDLKPDNDLVTGRA